MTTKANRMIADAKRAARRLTRTCTSSYQECLDMIARHSGHVHWGAYLADPVDVRTPPEDGVEVGALVPKLDNSPATVPLAVHNPPPPIAPRTFRTIETTGGEGIILGMDEARLDRSSRRATVLYVGEPGFGKTMGIVLPTIAMASVASQVIHDPKPELLTAVLSLGVRSHTRMLSLDLLAEARAPMERPTYQARRPSSMINP